VRRFVSARSSQQRQLIKGPREFRDIRNKTKAETKLSIKRIRPAIRG